LASPIHYQIFGPLTSTCGCPFLVQGQSLQVVLLVILHMSCPYHILHTPCIFPHIPCIPIIGIVS